MEPEQQKEHPQADGEEMDTEYGGKTAPTADFDESKVAPKERSKAWENFKRTEDRNKAKCNHCGQLVTIRSPSGVNTSTMLKHMQRCKKLHPELEVETVAGKRLKQSTLMHQPKKDKDGEDSISRIRSAVRYVRSSPARLDKFKECLLHLKLSSTSGVSLDVETRWNSTYLMLESALKLKRGFDMLELEDDKFLVELGKSGGAPTESDWDYAKTYLPILKFFYDATLKVSATRYVTGNMYLKEIFGVGLMIRKLGLNKVDLDQKAMAVKMKAKFDKYWGNMENMNLVIFIACVIDPWYKMKYVSLFIRESYGSGGDNMAKALIEKVNTVIEKMFKYYQAKASSSSP
ncbi:hypothetical protein Bca4012_019750 [Brassica carinata]